MSLFTSLIAGQRGLRAASAAITTTSHNVANAGNPDYTRRRVEVSTVDPLLVAGGAWLGMGVKVDRIRRASDQILGMRRVEQQSSTSMATMEHKALQSVQGLFDEAERLGMREALDKFFDSMVSATADPSDRGLRQAVLASGELLGRTVRTTAKGIEDQLSSFESQIGSYIEGINDKLLQVAAVNAQIRAAGGDLAIGDLADRRDAVIKDLAGEIGATVYFSTEGLATVFIAGQAVVSGLDARTVSIETPAGGGTPKFFVSADDGRIDVTDEIGGEIGGLIDAHGKVSSYIDALDTFAVDFSNAINPQHIVGVDLTGAPGENLFRYGATGHASVQFELESAIVGNPDALAFSSSGKVGNGENLNALIALESNDSLIGGTSTAGSWLSEIATRVGRDASTAQDVYDQETAIMADLDELHNNLQGVDLDEEAANLIQYQAAYQAAAKVISATDSMLQVLLSLA